MVDVYDLTIGAHADLIVQLRPLVRMRVLSVLADQHEPGDQDCLDCQNDAEQAERVDVESPHESKNTSVDRDPNQEPEAMHEQEMRGADEADDPLGQEFMPFRLLLQLLQHILEVAERLTAVRVAAKDSVRRVFAAADRA